MVVLSLACNQATETVYSEEDRNILKGREHPKLCREQYLKEVFSGQTQLCLKGVLKGLELVTEANMHAR